MSDRAQSLIRQLGSDTTRQVHVVPAGCWQAARTSGEFTLVGCTVAPGFEFADFRFVADDPGREAVFDGPLSRYRSFL